MYKEYYERLKMDVTRFKAEDVITTSEAWTPPAFTNALWEQTNSVGPANGD